jgi:phospholipid-translocating ATPase
LNLYNDNLSKNNNIKTDKKIKKNLSDHKKEALSLENTMWASTILASKKAIGIVIYTGKEVRFQMNSSEPKTKKGALDIEINFLSKILFFIMLISAMIITLFKGFRASPLSIIFDFFRFVVLLSAIIPISLAVNLDISKTVNSLNISIDKRIPETIARNSTIPEELGRIEYIFTDKTGTLTKNEMLFKKLSMENDNFDKENFNDLKLILEDECKKFDAPALDILNISNNNNNINSYEDDPDSLNSKESCKLNNLNNNNSKKIRRNRNKIVRDMITAMALCNNVTPILEDDNDNDNDYNNNDVSNKDNNFMENISLSIIKTKDNDEVKKNKKELIKSESNSEKEKENVRDIKVKEKEKEKEIKLSKYKISYQASSPDEVALVKIAEELNFRLIHRNDKEIKVKNSNNIIEEFEILANFPFSSDTKRMGILLRNKKYGHIIFYLKGAESVMEKFVKEEYKSYIKENAENLAGIGLRTLVLTQKIISENFYEKWNQEYIEAKTSLDNRKEKIIQVMSKLEKNMDFLAVTGVEDLLQDEVCNTIESLRNAGIKIWMLTGDKVETATCISISAGLKNKSDKLFFIKEKSQEGNYVINQLRNIEINISQTVLVIDGDCLDIALNNHQKEFFEIAMKVK